MKPRDYCCCAIPTANVGIYAVLTEQFVLGILLGTLAVAAPSIVGSDSFTPWPFAIVCYVGAAIQIIGFMGVARDNSIIFRRYTTLHILITVGAFALAGAMIGLSAAHHDDAKADCLTDFFATNGTSTSTTSLGNTLCNIFPWVDVGVMGGLWLLLAISQFYFYTVVSGYGSFQRDPRGKYDSVYSTTNLTGGIPMADRSDPWDAHDSEERLANVPAAKHGRTESAASRFNEPYSDSPERPSNVYTQQTSPTPQQPQFNNRGYDDPYYNASNLSMPEQYQPHPAEGSFGRKTPKLQKASPF